MPLLPSEYANIKGKMHPTFPGVLRVAIEEKGLVSLSEEITDLRWMEASEQQITDSRTKQQRPLYDAGWYALAKATAVFRDNEGVERTFTGIGDCGPHNCDRMIAIHAPRMAGTRAKGRTLRDALGLDECLSEEMHEAPPVTAGDPDIHDYPCSQCGADVPWDQVKASRRKFNSKVVCSRCAAQFSDAPLPASSSPKDEYYCAECGDLVVPHLAAISLQKFGEILCLPDGKARVKAEKAKQAELVG